MAWLLLIAAGVFEVVWATGLKYTEGFTKIFPSVITVSAMGASFYLLSAALKTIPLGTGYAVWVGIGAVGTAIVGFVVLQEAVSPLKLVSLAFLVAGIVGLKMASSS